MKRDNFGFIELDEYNLEDNCFYMNNIKYYFKYIKNIKKSYNELIASDLALKFGIPCVLYDLGAINGNIGVFSEDFIKDGIYLPMEHILKKYYDDNNKANNLADIKKSLDLFFNNKEVSLKIMEEILKMCSFNFLIANNDNHNLNYGVLYKNGTYSLNPLYDNMNMLSEESIFEGIYSLGIDSSDYYSANDIFTKFIENYYEYIDFILDRIEIIDSLSIEDTLQNVEEKIHAYIPIDIRNKIKNGFKFNYNMINKKISKTKKIF